MKYWIIIDKQTGKALYGINKVTMLFSTKDVAKELADKFFAQPKEYLLTEITIKLIADKNKKIA